ncbi:CheR family methyltransferase [Legionella sp. W05-934-2]|jgi:hypothetical protein|uniref:CheR family methyltransferase n=1 Tax=Legionella sp. W05-934-2 TaxID=1198649 RepID=UPI003462E164
MIPIRLRPVTDKSIGTTAFFRNRILLETVCEMISSIEKKEIRVLFHACSIGSEVYSFMITTALDQRLAEKRIKVACCDQETSFLDFGKSAIYPCEVLKGMYPKEQNFFERIDENLIRVKQEIRNNVTFLPASSFRDFMYPEPFDVVFLLNALLYLPKEDQAVAIDNIAKYNNSLFITTGFHFDCIKQDLQRNHYQPYLENAKQIHDGWVDRRKAIMDANEVIPGKIYHPWSLAPYSTIKDYDYLYSAIFLKQGNERLGS